MAGRSRPLTDGEDATLRQLVREGKSRRQIGAIMGLGKYKAHYEIEKRGLRTAGKRQGHGGPRPVNIHAGWTKDREEKAARLWKEGKSAAEIGRALGKSRNSVISKVHKLGLTRTDQATKPAVTALPQKASGSRSMRHKPPPPSAEQRRRTAAVAGPVLTAAQIAAKREAQRQRDEAAQKLKAEAGEGARGVRVADSRTVHAHSSKRPYRVFHSDLGAGACRFPLNDGGPFLFCAKPCGHGQSYCRGHAHLCVQGRGSDLSKLAEVVR